MAKQQVVVPDIGGAEGAEVIELLVAVGDEVVVEQSLIVLESDKASMEIPSSLAGTVIELLVEEGQELSEGAPIAVLEIFADVEESAAAQENTPAQDVAAEELPEEALAELVIAPVEAVSPQERTAKVPDIVGAPEKATDKPSGEGKFSHAGPAVRKLAREFGLDMGVLTGTGPRGRIMKEDLHAFVQKSLKGESTVTATGGVVGIPAVPEVDFSAFGKVEQVSLSKMARLTAANMQRSWLNVPHVTQFDDADITELEVFRNDLKAEAERRGTKLTPMPFILKACAVALRDNPKFCSSLSGDGQSLVYKEYIHIGMAVDTPAGLLVPVIRDVDKKSLWELAEEVSEVAGKARDRKLRPDEMRGGCFTISSLGGIGGRGFTPIVNAPEVGILGVSKADIRPVWSGKKFKPRKMLPLALSYDHRVINGGDAGRFLTQYVALLSDIRRLVL